MVSTEQTAAVAAPKISKYLNIRCQSVRDLHMYVGVNIFRLVRAQTSVMLVRVTLRLNTYFNSYSLRDFGLARLFDFAQSSPARNRYTFSHTSLGGINFQLHFLQLAINLPGER